MLEILKQTLTLSYFKDKVGLNFYTKTKPHLFFEHLFPHVNKIFPRISA